VPDAEPSGLDAIKDRMARAKRTVPPPRHPGVPGRAPAPEAQQPPAATAGAPRYSAEAPAQLEPAPPEQPPEAPPPAAAGRPAHTAPEPAPRPRAAGAQQAPSRPPPPPIPLDEPLANLAVRVRRSLDMRVVHLVHELRRQRMIRSNKTELVEMLLWELPDEPDDNLAERLQRYRLAAPRP